MHPPGEVQADFAGALIMIAGVEQNAHFLAMDCPHSDDGFVAAFPGETTEVFKQRHVLAFEYLHSDLRNVSLGQVRWIDPGWRVHSLHTEA